MINIHALHGFLGLPSDWKAFNFESCYFHDFAQPEIAPCHDGFWGWAKRFNQYITSQNNVLMGYSMGGRLALHALLDQPEKWKAAVIISANPGVQSIEQKAARINADRVWADRFMHEPWQRLLKAWNDQEVFKGKQFPLSRHEHEFSRAHLSLLLTTFSLGLQEDLTLLMHQLNLPILWICGQQDSKFLELSKKINFFHKLSKVKTVEAAGHRVPWERPQQFKKLVQSFISEVYS